MSAEPPGVKHPHSPPGMAGVPKFHPLEAAVLALLFVAGIVSPFVKQHFFGEPDTSFIEKRILAPAPIVAGGFRSQVRFFPGKFDAWYGDHFGFRAVLLEAGAVIKVRGFGDSDRVMIGKEGWLYLKMDPPLFTQSFDAKQLAGWKEYLEGRQRWLAARGIKYLFVVPPDKDSIYPEFLPSKAGTPPAELPVDQLVRYLKETHSPVDILSLREAVLAGKRREQAPIYYKQDTHWNSLGAFYGYQEIIRRLSDEVPNLKAIPRNDYRVVFAKEEMHDIADLAGLPAFTILTGPKLAPASPGVINAFELRPYVANHPYTVQMPHPANEPRAVVFCDSYTMALAPYYAQSFSRVTYFWPSTYQGLEKALGETVLAEKPDIFIEERLQRLVVAVPEVAPFADAAGSKP
ncbi:MAG TPA: hypothetical protein VG733_18895 [Chthoniobacteraceae bacterium]|nr:hypothetical protein [Chthoniobacteraceae bacterium]